MVRKSLQVKGGFWPRTAGRGRCRGNGFGFRWRAHTALPPACAT